MSKKRKNPSPQNPQPRFSAQPAAPSGRSGPTPEQRAEVEALSSQAPPLPPEVKLGEAPVAETVTLEQLLRDARNAAHCYNAAKRELDAEKARLQKQREDAETAKRDLERSQVEHKAKLAELDQREKQLKAELDQREKRLNDNGAAQEQGFIERDKRLTARELNAEDGFLAERRNILGALEDHVATLRRERDELTTELLQRRTKDEADWRTRHDKRAQDWRTEDEVRAREIAAAREKATKELESERLRRQLELETAFQQRQSVMNQRHQQEDTDHAQGIQRERKELTEERGALEAEQKKLRIAVNKLQADCELLGEDREAFDQRVERRAVSVIAELEHEREALREELRIAKEARDLYFVQLQKHAELDRRFGNQRPDQVFDRLQALERDHDQLQEELQQRLGDKAQVRLAELERAQSSWREEESVLRSELAETKQRVTRLRIAATEIEGLRGQLEALETNKKLLETALQNLRAEVDRYTQADEQRNPLEALAAIDRNERLQSEVRTLPPVGGHITSLPEFVEDLRHRVAVGLGDRPLYYSLEDLRCLLGGLAMSKLHLYQGISGTGKTSLPVAVAKALGADHEVVEVQAGWRDRQDLVGYYNAFHRHFYATNFLQALYRAGTPAYSDRLCFIVLDEINLSRVEQFFADFISALELPEDERRLTLLPDPLANPPRLLSEGRHLPIPRNVWFIGTANHDESTTEFADKTYDRAHVMELPRRPASFSPVAKRERSPISLAKLNELFADAQKQHEKSTTSVLSWLHDSELATQLDRRFRIGWGNRLRRDAERFVPVVVGLGGSVAESLDHLLASKVLRKLRDRHDVRPRALEEVKELLLKEWGKLPKHSGLPTKCLAVIDRELGAKQDEEEV